MPTTRAKSESTEAVATESESTPSTTPNSSKTAKPPVVKLQTDEMYEERSALSDEVDPDAGPEEWVLFLYDPLCVGRGVHSEHSVTIPVKVNMATEKGALNTYEYRSLAKGLQRIRKVDAELIMACKSKPFREMVQRNVIRFWSEEWELSKMKEPLALDSIRRCEQGTLLDMWMEDLKRYTRPIQEALTKRKAELSNPSNLQQV